MSQVVDVIGSKLGRKQLFTVLKIAERCNLKCPYCYFFFAGDESYKSDPKVIPMGVVEDTARFLHAGAVELGLGRVDISLHGGEPMMVGKKRFKAICDTLRAPFQSADGPRLRLNIQTNGVLIDEEWVDILKEYRIGVGVSLDGPKHIHDKVRIDHRNRGTYDQTARGIALLQRRMGVAALVVIPPDESGREVFNHVVDDLGIKTIDFLFPIQNWDNHDPDLTTKVTRFYREVFEAWVERNDPEVQIRTLSDRLRALISDAGAEFRTSGLKDICDSITIRSNGDLCPDDTLHSLRPDYRDTGFNVRSATLRDFMSAPFWEDLRIAVLEPRGECSTCKWWGICRGGHADHRYAAGDGFRRGSTYCDTYKTMHQQTYDYVNRSIRAENLEERLKKCAIA